MDGMKQPFGDLPHEAATSGAGDLGRGTCSWDFLFNRFERLAGRGAHDKTATQKKMSQCIVTYNPRHDHS